MTCSFLCNRKFLLHKKRSAKGANSPVDYCLAPTVVERRAHAFGNNVAFSDAKAAPACRRHALFLYRLTMSNDLFSVVAKYNILYLDNCVTNKAPII